jgi:hypothetical protein
MDRERYNECLKILKNPPKQNIQECQTYYVQHPSHVDYTMQERPTQEHLTQECSTKEYPRTLNSYISEVSK